jgi:probable phosphomutase (TIGR03848 family)
MTTVLLIRHALNDHVTSGRLAGRLPEVHLSEEGLAQAAALGQRLRDVPLGALFASPLERTMETAAAIQAHHPALHVQPSEAVIEVDYGDWQGKAIAELRTRKMWHLVQEYPSRAAFPGGETLRAAQVRIVDAVEALVGAHPAGMIAIVCHADLIKLAVAHFLGMHLDVFQRIVISPASITTLQFGYGRPYVATVNDTAHVQALATQTGRKG